MSRPVRPARWRLDVPSATALLLLTLSAWGGDAAPPQPVDALLQSSFGFGPAELQQVHAGRPIARLMPPRIDREVGVVGAIRIAAPAQRFVQVFEDIEHFEAGPGFLATHRISNPPRADDFATMHVPPDDVKALRSCRPGDCDVKLGGSVFPDLLRINWKGPDVQGQVDQMARGYALAYVTAYQAGGNRELAIYRDKERPTFIADEFADMVTRSGVLLERLPSLSRYLIDYPANRPPQADDFFYWSIAEFGLKPVTRLNHVIVEPASGSDGLRFAIATKQLYASHYFHTALEVRALFDDPERPGAAHYLVALNLARSDGLTGLFGGIVRSKVRKSSLEGMTAALTATKAAVEHATGSR